MTATEEFWPGILATASQLDERSYYELLGVDRDASPDAIGQAYYAQVRRLHPDRHAMETDAGRKSALVRVYARVGEAYRVLTSPEKRKLYDQGLDSGETRLSSDRQAAAPKPRTAGPTHPQAKALYQRGKAMLARKDKRGARAQWQLAIQFEPDCQEIRDALAGLDNEGGMPLPAEGVTPAPAPSSARPGNPGRGDGPGGAAIRPGNKKASASFKSSPVTEVTVPGQSLIQPGLHSTGQRAADAPAPVPIPCTTWEKVEALYLHKIQGEGMAIRSAYAPPVGTTIPLAIQLPDGLTIELSSEVVSVGPARKPGRWSIRLAFAGLSSEAQAFFETSLASHGRQWTQDEEFAPATSPPDPDPDPDEPARIHAGPLEIEPVGDEAAPAPPDDVLDDPDDLDDLDDGIEEDAADGAATVSDTEEMDASMLAEQLLDVLPDTAPILEDDAALGRRALAEQRYAMACDYLGRSLEKNPDSDAVRALFYIAVGHQTEATGNTREAQIHFQTALKLDASAIEWLK